MVTRSKYFLYNLYIKSYFLFQNDLNEPFVCLSFHPFWIIEVYILVIIRCSRCTACIGHDCVDISLQKHYISWYLLADVLRRRRHLFFPPFMPNQIILRLFVVQEYFRKIAMTNLDYENDTELYVLYFSKHLSILFFNPQCQNKYFVYPFQ